MPDEIAYCPRCDRSYSSEAKMKKHFFMAHPDMPADYFDE